MATERQHPGEWQIESIRATFFLSEALTDLGSGLWAKLIGAPPETSTSQPRSHSFRDEGPLGSNYLILQSSPGRIDVVLAPQLREDVSFPSIGRLSEPQNEFEAAVDKLVAFIKESVQRVAYGLVLRLPVASREEGYRSLVDYLHKVEIDPETSWDFLYQVNRKRTISVAGTQYRINRLSKWGVMAVVRTLLSPVERSAVLGLGVRQASEVVFASSLELDMSTAADLENKIPSEHVAELLKKLSDGAKEIACQGDIA